MSDKQFQRKPKRIQKLGRNGLVEQDKATGQKERISQRAADVDFGPSHSQDQVVGRASSQRTPAQGRRRKQPQSSPPRSPVPPVDGDVLDVPEIAPTMRQADDVPATASPPRTDGTSSIKRRQQKRATETQNPRSTTGCCPYTSDPPSISASFSLELHCFQFHLPCGVDPKYLGYNPFPALSWFGSFTNFRCNPP